MFEDAAEALYKLKTGDVSTDLIFLDLSMPGMTGLEFLKELRKNETLRQIPVVVLTGGSDANNVRETQQLREWPARPKSGFSCLSQ